MEPQVVGLVGCDFSGSTLMSSILNGIDGVASVGETHWIVDQERGCRECYSAPCPVFSPELLGRLQDIPEEDRAGRWWPILAEATGAQVVVSSDKRPRHYKRLGWPDTFVFLYKDPVAHVYSKARRLATEKGHECVTDDDVAEALEWLILHSNAHLRFLENREKPVAVLKNENFILDPEAVLQRLCAFLGVETDLTALDYWTKEHHYIGGNFSVRARRASKETDHTLRVDQTYAEQLTSGQQELIRDSSGMGEVLERISSSAANNDWTMLA